mmetsp:Transcript_4686/g.7087  ORF Transcript_4686/g.7087 Transcript_4686/m.7087 type:complete len:105 (-) Transcript_4686:1897-2211(-)
MNYYCCKQLQNILIDSSAIQKSRQQGKRTILGCYLWAFSAAIQSIVSSRVTVLRYIFLVDVVKNFLAVPELNTVSVISNAEFPFSSWKEIVLFGSTIDSVGVKF